jgi:hypothetical protein
LFSMSLFSLVSEGSSHTTGLRTPRKEVRQK